MREGTDDYRRALANDVGHDVDVVLAAHVFDLRHGDGACGGRASDVTLQPIATAVGRSYNNKARRVRRS